jgi:hypothetical protein
MSAALFEKFLAQLYVDEKARARFLRNPRREAKTAGFTEEECVALEKIDRLGLELAANSFAKKRGQVRRQEKTGAFSFLCKTFVRYFFHPR